MKKYVFGLLIGLLCCSTLGCSATPLMEPTAAIAGESTAGSDYLGAVGIGVRDLTVSAEFYRQVLGLEIQRTYELGYINEIVLGYPNSNSAVLVLMHWPGDTERRYDGTDVKNVFYVDDPKGVIERIRKLGGKIDRDALPHEAVGGLLVGLGRDPDNYVVEVLQR